MTSGRDQVRSGTGGRDQVRSGDRWQGPGQVGGQAAGVRSGRGTGDRDQVRSGTGGGARGQIRLGGRKKEFINS